MHKRKIRTENAVGRVIAHDLTQVVPGEFKGARFEKGDVIEKDDIHLLKKMGKDHVFVIDLSEDQLHEDEAALRISEAVNGPGVSSSEPTEGKVEFEAEYRGLLKVDRELLFEANDLEEVLISSRHDNTPVEKGSDFAGARVNSLVVSSSRVEKLETLLGDRFLFSVKSYSNPSVGLVVTGTEVYEGRIEDQFLPTLKRKLSRWGGSLMEEVPVVPDDQDEITSALCSLKESGADILIAGGGMSVDPDDLTPEGIRKTGANVVSYGVPALPGNKLMLAYLGEVPVIGLPACVLFDKVTTFDLIFPRILAGEKLERSDLLKLSHGGYCLHCETCTYPDCSFGKG